MSINHIYFINIHQLKLDSNQSAIVSISPENISTIVNHKLGQQTDQFIHISNLL